MTAAHAGYYIPHGTRWPIIGSFGLLFTAVGFASYMNGASFGKVSLIVGLCTILVMMFLWFGQVIRESESGTYNDQVDMSFRMGMGWFIFSEVMFFAAFFGALFYAREYSVPWLAGEGAKFETMNQLWQGFEAVWPTNGPDDVGGAFETVGAWGIPAVNTLLLLSSGVTITIAHWALKKSQRGKLAFWMLATVLLGAAFLYLQAHEYGHAWNELNLTLGSGIYGSTFYMLTGFHGFHVTMGALMLTVILLRILKGHFTPQHHFAFEAVAWYWHFVDVVWLGLFIFVYWF
jgi:cytochrome c oxidase subunit 3